MESSSKALALLFKPGSKGCRAALEEQAATPVSLLVENLVEPGTSVQKYLTRKLSNEEREVKIYHQCILGEILIRVM